MLHEPAALSLHMGFVYFHLCRHGCFFMERDHKNKSSRAWKYLSKVVGNSTLQIFFSACRSEKGRREGKKIEVCMCRWKGCGVPCICKTTSTVGRYQKRLSVHQCYNSLLMFWWPTNLWGTTPCSRGHELLCYLRACLLQSSLLILLGHDILLGHCSSVVGLWLSCWR